MKLSIPFPSHPWKPALAVISAIFGLLMTTSVAAHAGTDEITPNVNSASAQP